MSRTAYIHMGAHKTGSTAIQGWLKANADSMRAAGIALPLDLAGHKFNYSTLAVALCTLPKDMLPPHRQNRRIFTDWLKATPDVDILLSSERFSTSAAREPINAAKTYFDRHGFETTAVFYMRNRVDWLNSSLAQRSKRMNASVKLDKPIVPEIIQRVNWLRCLTRIEKTGMTVRAGLYPPRKDISLPEHFCKLAGIDDRLPGDTSFETEKANASLGEVGVLLATLIRAMLHVETPVTSRVLLSNNLIASMAGLPDRTFNGLTERQVAHLEEKFAPEDEQLLRWISEDDLARLSESKTKGLPRSPLRVRQMDGEQARTFAEAANRLADIVASDQELTALISARDIRALVPQQRPPRKATA